MPTITTKDGIEIYYKDWGSGQPIVFSHGWPLSADAFEDQMFYLANRGYRCIAHDRRLRHAALAVATQVVHHLTPACRVTDMNSVFEIEMPSQLGQVVGVVIHVVAVAALRGPAMSAPVVGYDAITLVEEEHHLRVPIVGGQRPTVAEYHGLTLAPVLVINLDSVFCGNRRHK